MKIRKHPDWPEDKRIFIDQWDYKNDRQAWSLKFEFNFKPWWYGFIAQVGAGDGYDEVALHLGFPFLTLYTTFEHHLLSKLLRKFPHLGYGYNLPKEHKDRWGSHGHEIHLQWIPQHSKVSVFLWQYALNGSDARTFTLFYDYLLFGKPKYEKKVLSSGTTQIAMPEGMYSATYEVILQTWWRSRFPFLKSSRESIYFEIEEGIPHWGKGENSWDCGMDATFGTGTEWRGNLHDATKKIALQCLETRSRYGSLFDPAYFKWKSERAVQMKTKEEQIKERAL